MVAPVFPTTLPVRSYGSIVCWVASADGAGVPAPQPASQTQAATAAACQIFVIVSPRLVGLYLLVRLSTKKTAEAACPPQLPKSCDKSGSTGQVLTAISCQC